MANSPRFQCELDVVEKQWISKALELQRAALIRSRQRELAGSEIYGLRSKEIEALTVLKLKFD